MEGLILFGGGYPIMDGDAMIGGLGVSGGHYTQDMECGDAALAQV
ncbi:MAG: heme-binding protein [Alphaproteobacteria bacterium]